MKKLKDPEEPLVRFFDRADASAPRSARCCTSCRRAGRLNLERLEPSSRALPRRRCARRSSSARPAGTTTACSRCSSATASRSACTTCRARRPARWRSARACYVPLPPRDVEVRRPLRGRRLDDVGGLARRARARRDSTCSPISTTTWAATRRGMRCACARVCSRDLHDADACRSACASPQQPECHESHKDHQGNQLDSRWGRQGRRGGSARQQATSLWLSAWPAVPARRAACFAGRPVEPSLPTVLRVVLRASASPWPT